MFSLFYRVNIILLIELKGIHKSVGKLQLWIIKWQIGTNMVGVLAIPPEGQREEQIAFSAWSVESIHINKSALFYLEDIDSPVLLSLFVKVSNTLLLLSCHSLLTCKPFTSLSWKPCAKHKFSCKASSKWPLL